MIVAVLVIFAGISLISLSAMPRKSCPRMGPDPSLALQTISRSNYQEYLKPLIAVLAGTILFIATNAGLIGISRLLPRAVTTVPPP
jgi:hypothetical protein